MRKHISGYLKGLPHISRLRQEMVIKKNLAEIFELLDMLKENKHIKTLAEQLAEESNALDMTCSTENQQC